MSNVAATREFCRSHRFGRFDLQPGERRLLADGQPIPLGARAFDVLVVLVERAGQLVAKNDLLTLVWPNLVVEENNLQVQISTLRKVLGQNALSTIPGRGYRFELAVERADAMTTPVPPAGNAPASSTVAPRPLRARTNLPAHLLSLYGRAHDLATIKTLLRQHAVVTIVGAGGIGKTRVAQSVAAEVAVESAADFPDGVWWVELAALSDGALVPSSVARALGAQLLGDRPPVEAIALLLASQRMLLVLDNCEHLAASVTGFIETVRAAASQVRFLTTSQETLKGAEEHIYRVEGLAIPASDGSANALQAGAVELFVARAQGVDPNFALTRANAPAVIEICRRLDGIPLAIELAAARLPLLGVEGLRARLDERFNVLTAGARVVLRRHQTLRATLDWSHSLLTQDESTVFRRLGVFASRFTLEGAQHVASDDRIDAWAALEHLGTLVDKSLVLAEGDPLPRYRLLETTRAYALERLAEAGETDGVLRRHAESTLESLSYFDVDDRRWQHTQAEMRSKVPELDDLRAALAWVVAANAGSDLIVRLGGASYHGWWATWHLAEGLERCLALRAHVNDSVPAHDAALYWFTLAKLGQNGMRRECYDAALRAADLYRRLGDDSRRYDALLCAAQRGFRFGSAEDMEQAIAEATRLERLDWPGRQRGSLQFARFRWYSRLGRHEEALECAHRQAAIYRESGVPIGEQYAMSNVTTAEIELGRTDAALEHARAAITKLDELGAATGAGHLWANATIALILLDRADEALAAGRTAHALLKREGDEYRMLSPLAMISALQGQLPAAARIIGFDDAINARIGNAVRPQGALLRLRLAALLNAALPADELARLRAEGAAMRDEQVFRLGFGDDA